MITATCQRWRERRDSYRPAGETIATRLYEVAPILALQAHTSRFFALSSRRFTCSYSTSRIRSDRVVMRPGCFAIVSATSASSNAISDFGMRMLNWISSAGLGFRGTSTA